MSSPHEESLPLDAVRRIDQLCDRFERALQKRQTPKIEEFLSQVESPYRAALLRALLEVELEYRRAWGERPELAEYLARFKESSVVAAAFTEAAPASDSAERAFDLLQIALANASGKRTDRLRIYYRGMLVHTAALSGPLELGRQRQGEAAPYTLTEGDSGPRLVIAPLEETTISRIHLRLIPEEQDLLRVVNLSRINPILFRDGRSLEAEHSETLPLTVEMTLGALFLRIDQPSLDDSAASDESSSSDAVTQALPEPEESPQSLLDRLRNWRRS